MIWNIYLYDMTRILQIARITKDEFKIIEIEMSKRFDKNLIHSVHDIYDSFKIGCLLLRPLCYWEYLETSDIF